MDTLSIGMKAEYALELGTRIAEEARTAMMNGESQGAPVTFELTVEATDNQSADQVTVTFSNDDMERDEVARDQIYVDADR